MIHNFRCVICNRYKSHGRPRKKDGRWVCVECINQINKKIEDFKDDK